MNFFIAGVSVDICSQTDVNALEVLIKAFPTIISDAKKMMGDDTVIIMVLPEYALTPIAVYNKNKKQQISELKNMVEPYDNIILIPGSFASYQLLQEKMIKKEKIKNHYSLLNQYIFFKDKKLFKGEYSNYESNIESPDVYCLQNSTYILTKNAKYKHHKSSPYHEEKRLVLPVDYVFDIGVETLPRKIIMKNQEIDMRVLVCLEHHLINDIKNCGVEPPLIEVIISDTTKRKQENLYGALCIHMDSKHKLYVGMNSLHQKATLIQKVNARYYTASPSIEQVDVVKVTSSDIPIDYFDLKIRSEWPSKNEDIMDQSSHGFFNEPVSPKSRFF